MARTKFSRGPWQAAADSDRGVRIYSPNDGTVGFTTARNAPLIQAAPEMFEILKQLVEKAAGMGVEKGRFAVAADLIARIEGEGICISCGVIYNLTDSASPGRCPRCSGSGLPNPR